MPGMTTTPHPEAAALLAGDFPRRFMTITVASGQVRPAGAVMGEVTADEKYILSASAATDGSQTPSVILWEAVDATDGDVEAEALICGDVRGDKLTLGAGHTVASVRKALRSLSIFVR
ncbi:head decoration protein [Halomonas sp. BMC6]|uniref:head decoration protein n=1 Tax=Halomonas sp. BMC6 TaxID=3073244 RepID=UPI0030CFB016